MVNYGYGEMNEVFTKWNYESCKELVNGFTDEQVTDMQGYMEKFKGFSYEDISEEELKLAVVIDYITDGLVEAALDRNRERFYKALELYIRICL